MKVKRLIEPPSWVSTLSSVQRRALYWDISEHMPTITLGLVMLDRVVHQTQRQSHEIPQGHSARHNEQESRTTFLRGHNP